MTHLSLKHINSRELTLLESESNSVNLIVKYVILIDFQNYYFDNLMKKKIFSFN